jgi:hypothetical protein
VIGKRARHVGVVVGVRVQFVRTCIATLVEVTEKFGENQSTMEDPSDHIKSEVKEKFGENQSKMDDFSDDMKSEDTSGTLDLPPPDKDADNAGDVDFVEAVIPSRAENKPAEILVEIDQDRKKVITLNDGGYDSLVESFSEAVAKDPGSTEYDISTVVFQIFNHKFNTWVDLDRSKKLTDGSHLKAAFLTQTKLDTESKHKSSETSKRRLADFSDNGGDDCKSQSCSSDDDSVRAKRICATIKTCVTDAEKTSMTSRSIHSHDLTDNSVSPASEGLCHQLLMLPCHVRTAGLPLREIFLCNI